MADLKCDVELGPFQDEIARLRAEVKRLQASQTFGYWRTTAKALEQQVEVLEAQRDEALARLKNCGQENCMGWKLNDHTNWVTENRYNEALAQVAVLVRALENVLYAQLGGHLNPTDDGKKVLNMIRPIQSQAPREARALLDRLRQAEAVVEAASVFVNAIRKATDEWEEMTT